MVTVVLVFVVVLIALGPSVVGVGCALGSAPEDDKWEKWSFVAEYELFMSLFLAFLLKGKQPFDSSTGGQSNMRSGVSDPFGPKALNSL